MKKIIVPVDFSANSKKAVRFAIQLASKTKSEIIFLHIISIVQPVADVRWEYPYYAQFQDDELKLNQNYLVKLIKRVYNKSLPQGVKYKCICQLSTNIGHEVIEFAKTQNADFICVGASGTTFLGKLFGTVASHLILHSPIPVFVIPRNYKNRPITDICYASDMENPEPEINNVLKLAKTLRSKVSVVHFDYGIGLEENRGKLNEVTNKFKSGNISFQFKELNALNPLNDHLRKAVNTLKPSLVVLFTKQNRSWYDRLIISSNSVDMSFSAKVPLLIFRK